MMSFLQKRICSVRSLLTILITVLLVPALLAQHAEQDLPPGDSTRVESRLYDIMKHGTLDGRFRQYSMATLNEGVPNDYYAIAFGGALTYSSQRWHGLQFKLTGGYTFDLSSSDLTVNDPVTGLPNRYEIGLFDVTNPRSTNDVAYLQEFQLNYVSRVKRTRIVFGKQALNTPFLNAQDGRMHPTFFEGLWGKHTTEHGLTFEGGWIYRVAPRSTSNWYRVDESVGLYPVGRNTLGEPSTYASSQNSSGIVALSAKRTIQQALTLTAWDLLVENMFNTAMIQADLGERTDRWSFSGLALQQTPIAHGLPSETSSAYMPTGEESVAFSARIRNVLGKFRWQANYTRITKGGRYLMPREWGRDPFFTFLPRERNEGLGDVHAITVNLIWKDLRPGLRLETDAGLYLLPSVSDARLNKYTMPSYAQYNLNIQYQFRGGWQGLAAQVLYLYKMPLPGQELTDRPVFNKVNMHHVDLILNYVF